MSTTKRNNDFLTETVVLTYDHVQVTADTTIKLFKAKRPFRIDSVQYINVTGLVQDAANYFNIKILNAAAVAANHSTETGQEGTIAADTFVELELSATDANLVVAADAVLSLFLDETGTATLPAGRVVIQGRYL